MHKISSIIVSFTMIVSLAVSGFADVTVKQRVSMGGQSFESTRQIKGSRERTEQKMQMADPDAAAFMPQIVTITQCDLKRTVKLNDRKQLYLIEPFDTGMDAIAPARPGTPQRAVKTRPGGTVTISYSQRDTGERKTMFGMQARRLIITQEMESSADSCSGPNRTKFEFDGWYVDFSADFNCPTNRPAADVPRDMSKPDCTDQVVMKGNSSGKTGFLLEGTMKMYGPDGTVQMTNTTETLELSRATLDAALFDVPATYKLADSMQDLYAVSLADIGNMGRNNNERPAGRPLGMPSPTRSVGLNINFGSNASVNRAEIESHVRAALAGRGLDVVSGAGTYTLNIDFRQIKESAAGKIGGLFGKVTGVDAKVGKVDIDMTATLAGAATGDVKVRSKFDGPLNDGVRTAIDQALAQLLDKIK